MTDVFFYVQHLLGIGHVRRAAVLTRALDRAGLSVVLVSGGLPVPGLDIGAARLEQLPPLRVLDENFAALVEVDGAPVDDTWKAARARHLLQLFSVARPKVLVIEMFPFGRRMMRFELLPLLAAAAAARPRPRVICSLRDVLSAPRTAEKEDWMLATFRRYVDQLLVHGDPAFLPLERSFPRAGEIAEQTLYTGYVTDAPVAKPSGHGSGEVIVSTGGGAVAAPLIEAALAARPLSPLAAAPWRILVGDNLSESQFETYRRQAPNGVIVERARPDFPRLLAAASLSISQAGYNTVLEVLGAGIPAVVVPFAAADETEQALRARLLGERGAVVVVAESELSPSTLAAAIGRALTAPEPLPGLAGLDTGGAAKTAQIIRQAAAIVGQ